MDEINGLQVGQNIMRLLAARQKTQRELAQFCGVAGGIRTPADLMQKCLFYRAF